jgi:hypothetical protein
LIIAQARAAEQMSALRAAPGPEKYAPTAASPFSCAGGQGETCCKDLLAGSRGIAAGERNDVKAAKAKICDR